MRDAYHPGVDPKSRNFDVSRRSADLCASDRTADGPFGMRGGSAAVASARVLPGRPELSYLLTHPPDPSNANLLTAPERRAIERWILAGAPER